MKLWVVEADADPGKLGQRWSKKTLNYQVLHLNWLPTGMRGGMVCETMCRHTRPQVEHDVNGQWVSEWVIHNVLTTLIDEIAEGEAGGVWQVLTALQRLWPTALKALRKETVLVSEQLVKLHQFKGDQHSCLTTNLDTKIEKAGWTNSFPDLTSFVWPSIKLKGINLITINKLILLSTHLYPLLKNVVGKKKHYQNSYATCTSTKVPSSIHSKV